MSVFQERLQALSQSKVQEVNERDVLRVSGILGHSGVSNPFELAKTEILKWVKNRAGGELPAEAQNFEDFFVDVAGRNVECRAEDFGDVKIWGIRAEDPDKTMPGRIWKTEIILAKPIEGPVRLSLRLRVSNRGHDDQFVPSAPGIINQLIEKVGLKAERQPFSNETTFINDETSLDDFLSHLEGGDRKIPIILISQIPSKSYYAINPAELLKKVAGLAHVYCISDPLTWKLSERIGRYNSVFDGGIKTYNPSALFGSDEVDVSTQKLLTRRNIDAAANKDAVFRIIVSGACDQSLTNQRLGREIIAFSEFSTNLRKHRVQKISTISNNSAIENELLDALKSQVSSLETELKEKTDLENLAWDDNESLRQRVEEAERQQHNLLSRLRAIEKTSSSLSSEPWFDSENWSELIRWIEENFSGKIILTPAARRGAKKAEYENLEKVAKSIIWLADRGIEGRTSNSGATLKEEKITDGVVHAHCGGDAYEFDWQGNRYKADWHIKSGGNTHDPKRCLRIYYAWDPQSMQIIISDMPAHIKTAAS